jgi:hypothetical protein
MDTETIGPGDICRFATWEGDISTRWRSAIDRHPMDGGTWEILGKRSPGGLNRKIYRASDGGKQREAERLEKSRRESQCEWRVCS